MGLHSAQSGANLHDPRGSNAETLVLDDNSPGAIDVTTSTGSNQVVIVATNASGVVTQFDLLNDGASSDVTIHGTGSVKTTDGSGTDDKGEDFEIDAGVPTGTGLPGVVILRTTELGTSTGSTLQTARQYNAVQVGTGNGRWVSTQGSLAGAQEFQTTAKASLSGMSTSNVASVPTSDLFPSADKWLTVKALISANDGTDYFSAEVWGRLEWKNGTSTLTTGATGTIFSSASSGTWTGAISSSGENLLVTGSSSLGGTHEWSAVITLVASDA